jgi:MFS family permease
MIAVLSLAGLVGKLVFGAAADRVNLKYGLWSAHCLLLIAFSLLLLEPPYWVLLIAAVCFGLATGGLLPVWNAMVAQLFGVNSFGRAMGAMGPVITLSILPAYAVVGRLFDSTGSYSAGLILFGGIIVGAAAMLIPLRLND